MFRPQWSLGVNTINRILHTSLGEQLSSTGNISDNMFDFIDENKYFLSDNRTAFIQHDTKYSTFSIEDSNLPYSDWIELVYRKLCKSNNMFKPFTVIEKINSLNRNKRAAEESEELTSSGDCDVRTYKRQKLTESEVCFEHMKKDGFMKQEEKSDLIKTLVNNLSLIHVKQLSTIFTMKDGEYLIDRLSEEQKGCLYTMLEYAYPDDFKEDKSMVIKKNEKNFGKVFASIPKKELSNPFYKIFVIEGSAGCGKSAIIESLNFYSFKNHNKYTKLLYVTQTNVLCQSMHKKCFYNNNMQYLTFYKFLSTLNLSYFNTQQLLLNCDALKIDSFQNTCGTDFLTKIKSVIRLPNMPEGEFPENWPEKPRLFIIFDEVYTLTKGKLSLFLFMVRCLKQTYPKLTIYCILIGDKYQLRPFTKIEDIKVNVLKDNVSKKKEIKDEINKEIKKEKYEDDNIKKETNYDDGAGVFYDDDYGKKITEENEDALSELTKISMINQSESVQNATKFFLSQQFRIVDEEYKNFVNRVRDSEDRVDMGIQILEEFKSLWEEKIGNTLSVRYPIKDILNVLENLKTTDYKKIAIKFSEIGMFDKTIDTTLFCFTNMHAHYYNIALSFSYWNQIKKVCKKRTNFFISFVLIYNSTRIYSNVNLSFEENINRANYLVNVLPIIRYCPYKILSSNSPVARLSIVYIMDWIFDSKNEITSIVVFSPDTNLIFSIIPSRFDMNFMKAGFGFPLQFAFSSTFASSQGLTLNNKIAISCANISKAELYVCLTRIKKSKDLVRLY